jgi:F0F1-type ATP synthase membrane subunit b/b'
MNKKAKEYAAIIKEVNKQEIESNKVNNNAEVTTKVKNTSRAVSQLKPKCQKDMKDKSVNRSCINLLKIEDKKIILTPRREKDKSVNKSCINLFDK